MHCVLARDGFHRKRGTDVGSRIDNEAAVGRPRGIERVLPDKKSGRATVDRHTEQVGDSVIVRAGPANPLQSARELAIPLPPILRVSSELVLSNEIRRCLTAEDADLNCVQVLLETAKQYGISIDSSIETVFRARLELLMKGWASSPLELEALMRLQPLVSLLRIPPFEADLWEAQNAFYEVMIAISSLKPSHLSGQWLQHFRSLGDHLGIAVSQAFPALAPSLEERAWNKVASQSKPVLSKFQVEQISQ